MPNRRFNCCIYNHPCPIFCPIKLSCSNDVVNPIVSSAYGFFNNSAGGTFAFESQVPLGLVIFGGEGVASSSGSVFVTPGVYEVNYFAGGTVPAGGTLSVKLRLNGVDVDGSVITSVQTVGENVNLTRTIVVSADQGGILELANNSGESATFSFASMFVRRL
ncbi:MAG: hypothetical protein J6K39_03465 [Clostridia bacterium]|nr:hypothetical protein [Clostridia bacterium]